MGRRTRHLMTTLLIAAIVIVGCSQDEPDFAGQPKEPTSVNRTPISPQSEASSASKTRSAPEALKPKPGQAMVRMALPTGDFATSVLSLEKTAPKEVLVGKAFAYTIRLTNITDTDLKGVKLTGKLSENVALTGTAPKGVIEGSHAKWNVGVLGAKKTKTFAMQGSAKATGALVGCSEVTFDVPEVCLSIQAVQPALVAAGLEPRLPRQAARSALQQAALEPRPLTERRER